jgi:hypothetical protein
MHHAYLLIAPREVAPDVARRWVTEKLFLPETSLDVSLTTHEVFTVDDARTVGRIVSGKPVQGNSKAVIVCAGKFLQGAQQALLKQLEEPPEGTTIILSVPDAGSLLPTVLSRLVRLPDERLHSSPNLEIFSALPLEKRKTYIKKLLDDSSDEGKANAQKTTRLLVDEALVHFGTKENMSSHTRLLHDLLYFKTHLSGNAPALKMILEELAVRLPRK